MKKLIEFLSTLLCAIAAIVGLVAGGIVLIVFSLSNKILGSDAI